MDTILGLFFLAVAVALGLILVQTFDFSRKWVGLGDAPEPTGIPGKFRDWIYGPLEPVGETVTAA